MFGKTHSDESKAKMSRSRKGVPRKPHIEASKQIMREKAWGRVISPEARARCSATVKGRKRDPAAVAKTADWWRGRKQSPEHIEARMEGKAKAKSKKEANEH